ncbi:MAG: DeoR family transcriptional regulator [Halobacteria archaeon]|nr:DeoR family transcriptional regulator [Halobacteria archaeon]
MSKNRGDSGRYVESVTLEDVLGVFDSVKGPAITSADVARELDCSDDTARRKLSELHEQGHVNRRKSSGRVLWWLADESRRGEALKLGKEDPIFTRETFTAGEPNNVSENVDEYLYGNRDDRR